MNFKKAAMDFDGLTDGASCFFIGGDGSADGNATVFCDFLGHKPDALDIDVPVLFGKIEFG